MAFTFFLGGVRSGKTRFAQNWAQAQSGSQLMVATCYGNDPEMLTRIAQHKKSRGPSWRLLEEPLEPGEAIKGFRTKNPDFKGAIVIDSLGMWINNLMCQNMTPALIMRRTKQLGLYLASLDIPCGLISEECGLGFAPLGTVSRKYGDILGTANQLMARLSCCAIFVLAGLPIFLKGTPTSNAVES